MFINIKDAYGDASKVKLRYTSCLSETLTLVRLKDYLPFG